MLLREVLKSLIRLYAYLISPLTGPNCRFYPSCSHYAAEAIDMHGAFKGIFLALKRILKCHPWHKGPMLDPVPPAIDRMDGIGYKRASTKTPQNCGCANHKTKD